MNVNTTLTETGLVAKCDDGHVLKYDAVNYEFGRWVHQTGGELLACESWSGEQVIVPDETFA